jgi:SNF2 family DNA or RNA helicase
VILSLVHNALETGARAEFDKVEWFSEDAVRALPGSRFKKGVWSIPNTRTSVSIAIASLPGLELDDDLRDYLRRDGEDLASILSARILAQDPTNDENGNPDLYPYQRTGAVFLQWADGAILADSPGLGKTAQTIEALQNNEAYPALIVCPAAVRATWVREFAKWAPGVDVAVVSGTPKQREATLAEHHQVYVINWEALRLHSRLAPYGSIRLSDKEKTPGSLNRQWNVVVADEAHRALKAKSKQTRALWSVGGTAAMRIALTGTPIANNPADLWALLHFVAPDEWPSKVKFIDRYCTTSVNAFGGMEITGLNKENEEELQSLIAPHFLRRSKELALPWLPPKTYERLDVEMLPAQAKAYRQLEKDLIADLENGTTMALDSLTMTTRLLQMASGVCNLDESGKFRLVGPSPKVSALVELLSDLGDEPVVVFATSRQLIDLACAELEKDNISWCRIVGGQSEEERADAEEGFQSGRYRVILATVSAGGEGLTLTAAATTVFLDRPWSLVQRLQAVDRTHRPGQAADNVLIVDVVTPGTIEEAVVSALDNKGATLESIVKDKDALLRLLRRDDHAARNEQ